MDGAFAYHFDDNSIPPIKITETHDEIGCRVWDAATLLGKFLEAHAGELAGILAHRNIVELGAGTGITAMVAARLLPPSVRILATDIPTVCRATQATLASNSLDKRVTCEPLVWGNAEHIAAAHEWARSSLPRDESSGAGYSEAVAPAASAPEPPSGSSTAFDLVIACDIAAPIKFADSFVDTVAALLPPPPAAGSGATCVAGCGSAVGSGSADASSARAAAVEGAAAPAVGCGAGDSGSAASREGSSAEGEGLSAAASLGDLLRLPCALLACQMHRDITEPLLDGLRSVYGSSAVREVPHSLLHRSFRSPRHTLYVVATGARRCQ